MKIFCSSQNGFRPTVVHVLTQLSSAQTYQYDLRRPPLGIYNVSFNNVMRSLMYLLEELDKAITSEFFRKNDSYGSDIDILYRLENLYSSVMKYCDDCLSVLKSFFPPEKQSNYRSNKIVQEYERNIRDYRDDVARIFNAVKHRQHQFRTYFLFQDNWVIPGYFLESVDENGSLGPSSEFHERYKTRYTAFSYNRRLKYHLWGIYMIGEKLADAIQQLNQLPLVKANIEAGTIERSVLERIATLPLMFFIDENYKDVPIVRRIFNNQEDIEFELSFPDQAILLAPASIGETVYGWLSWIVDGISTQYQLPYFYSVGGKAELYIES
jgi:hypothetical protein